MGSRSTSPGRRGRGRVAAVLSSGSLWALVAIAAALVATVVLVSIGPRRPPPYTPVPGLSSRLSELRATVPTALWVGDAFAAGTPDGGVSAYPQLVCARLGWVCNLDVQAGTGYLADGRARTTPGDSTIQPAALIGRLSADVARYTADVVVVDAGREDSASTATIRTAVTRYLTAVRKAYPAARLVLVAPSSPRPDQPAALEQITEILRDAAVPTRAALIDPAGSGAFEEAARDRTLTAPDGYQLTAAGQAYYADLLTRLFKGAGVSQGAPVAEASTGT